VEHDGTDRLASAMDCFACGDDVAFDEVCTLALPPIRRFVRSMCRDPVLAQDITQETLLRIHRSRGSYRQRAAVLPWAYAIARNLFRDALKEQRLAQRLFAPERAGQVRRSIHGEEPTSSPEERLARVEVRQTLERALGLLPEAQATVLRLLKLQDLSVAEVASFLGITVGAVKLRAHRAYESLRHLSCLAD